MLRSIWKVSHTPVSLLQSRHNRIIDMSRRIQEDTRSHRRSMPVPFCHPGQATPFDGKSDDGFAQTKQQDTQQPPKEDNYDRSHIVRPVVLVHACLCEGTIVGSCGIRRRCCWWWIISHGWLVVWKQEIIGNNLISYYSCRFFVQFEAGSFIRARIAFSLEKYGIKTRTGLQKN